MGFMARKKYNFDTSGYCCQNEKCKQYKKENTGHIRLAFFRKHKCGKVACLRCTECQKRFSERKGTMFYRRRHSEETIDRALKSLAEGTGIRATARIFEVNFKSVLSWAKLGAEHIEKVEKKF